MPRSLHDALLDAAPTAGRELTTEVLVSKATTRRRRRRVVVASTLAVLVLAAGVAVAAGRPDSGRQVDTDLGTTVPAPTPTTEPGLVTPSADPLVSCNQDDVGHAFRASQLVDDGPPPDGSDPALGAMVRLVTDPQSAYLVPGHSTHWWMVHETDTEAVFLGESDGSHFQVIVAVRDGKWQFSSSGGCEPPYVLQPGLMNARLRLSGAVDPTSTTLPMDVELVECHGGARVPVDQLVGPQVQYRPDRVIVTFAVRPDASGMNTCPSNPPTAVDVTLSEPLGSRPVYDGSVFPPRLISG